MEMCVGGVGRVADLGMAWEILKRPKERDLKETGS